MGSIRDLRVTLEASYDELEQKKLEEAKEEVVPFDKVPQFYRNLLETMGNFKTNEKRKDCAVKLKGAVIYNVDQITACLVIGYKWLNMFDEAEEASGKK